MPNVTTVTVPSGTDAALDASLRSTFETVAHPLAVGESTIPREHIFTSSAVTLPSGTLRLTGFTARKSEAITQVAVWSGTTAAGATPTLVRVGIYEVDANGDLTSLVASTANDTTLFASTSTKYTRSLQATWQKVAGRRYAFGVLVVTAAAAPTMPGQALVAYDDVNPRMSTKVDAVSDLPATGTPAAYGGAAYAAMLP